MANSTSRPREIMSFSSEDMSVINRLHKSWEPAIAAWHQHVASDGGKTPNPSEYFPTLKSAEDQLNTAYDILVDVLGKQFAGGDSIFHSDMSELEQGMLSSLCASLKEPFSGGKRRTESGVKKIDPEDIAQMAMFQSRENLVHLASRLGYNTKESRLETPDQNSLFDDTDEVDWCKGALLNQQSPANYDSTIAQPAGAQSKTCKFCYLEISDYRSKAREQTDEDWSALASCHVLAYSSFGDRRAAYRCFGCDVRGISKIQVSTAAMSNHITSCTKFHEKRARAQRPPRPSGQSTYTPSSPSLTPRTDGSASSKASIPSVDHGQISSTRQTRPQPENRAVLQPNLPPMRFPPSIPVTTAPPPPTSAPPPPRTRPAYALRPETDASPQRAPGGFPAPQPGEPVYPYQQLPAVPTSGNQVPPHTPQRTVPVHRKAVTPAESNFGPQQPAMNHDQYAPKEPQQYQSLNSPQSRRPGSTAYLPESSPAAPRVPAQVRQLMELGASRTEAESRLQEANWDVQEAANQYLTDSMSRRQ